MLVSMESPIQQGYFPRYASPKQLYLTESDHTVEKPSSLFLPTNAWRKLYETWTVFRYALVPEYQHPHHT